MIKKVKIEDIKVRVYDYVNKGHIVINPLDSPHYKYINGDKDEYITYMNNVYQPEHSPYIFDKLIKNFDINKMGNIVCKYIDGEYIVQDGFHRTCILLYKNVEYVNIKIIN